MVCFLSRRYRPNHWPAYVLCGIELGLTVALLAFTGIASPDLYRTKLWQDGANNNFNSSPLAGVYAAANYRPYKTPMVWSQFLTNYNLVVVVLSMFLLLCKSTLYMLHVFPPVCSAVLHAILSALYAISVAFQASSDTTDPRRPQNGPAWFITKSCSVASNPKNIGYCLQAKALFACSVVMLAVMLTYLGFGIFSCFPSKEHQIEYQERQRAKKERWAHLDDLEETKTGNAYEVPSTPDLGKMNPMTPRTLTFNLLGGTKGLSRTGEKKKQHFSSPNPPTASASGTSTSRMNEKLAGGSVITEANGEGSSSNSENGQSGQMYFPPPPKKSNRK